MSSTITARPLIRWEWVIRLAAFGPRAVLPATVAARWFRTEQARALFGDAAAHMFSRLDQPLTAAMGLIFLASGYRFGWPVAEGGSGSITAALAAALRDHGGAITTRVTITSRRDIPDADVVMLDLTPAAAVQIYGDSMPGRIKRSYRRYREGSSERPFTLVGQQYLADPSRSSGNINPIWTYAHVPFGWSCSGPGWRSIPTSPACPASICARSPRRPAPVSTGCAAITPPSRRCAGCAGESATQSA